MNPARIAFVAHLSEVSGSGVALLEAAAAFAEMGYKVSLILPGTGQLAERARQRGIDPIVLLNPEVALTEGSLLHKLRVTGKRVGYVTKLTQFFRREEIDVVYINSSANIFPGIAARLAGKPIAWHIHETLQKNNWRSRWKKLIIRRVADGLLYASRSSMDALPPPDGVPAIVALNYISIGKFTAQKPRAAESQIAHRPIIFMSGTVAMKGADILLRAMQLLLQKQLAQKPLVFIAGPPLREVQFKATLDALITTPELKNCVVFTGLLDSLADRLASADCFVSPSRTEALPIAIVEAMAAGVPVVATDVGDCAELLEHGRCGWVVPAEDPGAMAEAIYEALMNPEIAAAKADAAFEKVKRLYGSDDFWQPLVQFVELVAARR